MADLVGNHVGLGEIAGRMKAVLQLPVEVEVDIDLVIEGAIERSHRRPTDAARRLHFASEQHQRRLLVALSSGLEDAIPDILSIGQHAAHEARHLIVLRRHTLPGARELEGRARSGAGGWKFRKPGSAANAAEKFQRVDPHHQAETTDDEERGVPEAPPANGDGNPTHATTERAATLTPTVLHVLAFPVAFTVSHAWILMFSDWASQRERPAVPNRSLP